MKKNANFENIIYEIKKSNTDFDASGKYKKCYYTKDLAILRKKPLEGELNFLPKNPAKQQKAIENIKNLGFKTPSILYYSQNNIMSFAINSINENDYFEIQERAKGETLMVLPDDKRFDDMPKNNNLQIREIEHCCDDINKERFLKILSAPKEHISKYLDNFFIGFQLGILKDAHSQNIYYDKKEGFTFIDLPKVPYFKNNEMYNRILSLPFNMKGFLSKASERLSTFIWISDQINTKPISNMLHHKIYESLLDCTTIPLSENNLQQAKEFLLPSASTYAGPYTTNETALFIDFLDKKDGTKLLEHCKDTRNNGFEPSISFGRNKDSKTGLKNLLESTDQNFLNRCLDVATIKDKPAREYYNNLPIITDSLTHQTTDEPIKE